MFLKGGEKLCYNDDVVFRKETQHNLITRPPEIFTTRKGAIFTTGSKLSD